MPGSVAMLDHRKVIKDARELIEGVQKLAEENAKLRLQVKQLKGITRDLNLQIDSMEKKAVVDARSEEYKSVNIQ